MIDDNILAEYDTFASDSNEHWCGGRPSVRGSAIRHRNDIIIKLVCEVRVLQEELSTKVIERSAENASRSMNARREGGTGL